MAWSGSFDIFIEVILIELCCEVLIDRNIDLSLSVMFFLFSGQPRRHLLTTGWSLFVSQKNLVSGDAVLFLRYRCLINHLLAFWTPHGSQSISFLIEMKANFYHIFLMKSIYFAKKKKRKDLHIS